MYNEDLKRQFMKTYTNSKATIKICETIFNTFEKSELEWDADLCTKSAAELQPVVNQLVGLRARSKWARLIVLKDYVRWCIQMGVKDACDGMLEITKIGLDKVKTQTLASPKSLQNYLNAICEPEDNKTTDNIYRCYYWLAYAGMDEDDILSVKCSDVDFRNMVVNYERKSTSVPIYTEALKAFRNCVELDSFVISHPNYKKTVIKPRTDGDTLIRGVRSQVTTKSLRVELSRRSKNHEDKTEFRMSFFRVWISGIFFRMYEEELVGNSPYFDDIVEGQMEGKTYKLDSGRNTMAAKKRQLVRDYEEDYERWKLAWH